MPTQKSASRDAGRATSLASTVQQLSLGFGVTVSGALVQLTQYLHHHETLQANDFWPAFLGVGLFSVASIPFTARLPRNAAEELAGRGQAISKTVENAPG